MRFIQFLEEIRKNPDKNPKISIVQALEPYKDDDEYFVSFVDSFKSFGSSGTLTGTRSPGQPKLGINPNSSYKSSGSIPGIYAYKLKTIFPSIKKGKRFFGSDKPYCMLIKCNTLDRLLKLESYDDDDYRRDINKLKSLTEYSDIKHEIYTRDIKTNKAVTKNITYIEYIDELIDAYNINIEKGSTFHPNNPRNKIIYIVNTLSGFVNAKNELTIQNNLYTKLGYIGIDDTLGLLHYEFKFQTVFFSTNYIKVIDSIPNKRYDGKSIDFYYTDHIIENYLEKFKYIKRSSNINVNYIISLFDSLEKETEVKKIDASHAGVFDKAEQIFDEPFVDRLKELPNMHKILIDFCKNNKKNKYVWPILNAVRRYI